MSEPSEVKCGPQRFVVLLTERQVYETWMRIAATEPPHQSDEFWYKFAEALNLLLITPAKEAAKKTIEPWLRDTVGPLVEAGQAMREILGSMVRCVGFPDCDGDLPGEPHSEKCVAARTPSTTDDWDAALQRFREGSKG